MSDAVSSTADVGAVMDLVIRTSKALVVAKEFSEVILVSKGFREGGIYRSSRATLVERLGNLSELVDIIESLEEAHFACVSMMQLFPDWESWTLDFPNERAFRREDV